MKITAKIILIILITLTSIGAAILIGSTWNNYFQEETESAAYDGIAMTSYFFQMGILWLFMDSIWIILFFILYKKSKKKK